MKDTLKKIIIIALISVSFIAIFLEKSSLAKNVSTYNKVEINLESKLATADSSDDLAPEKSESDKTDDSTESKDDKKKEIDEDKHYTIEDIVYNRVPILDVNFFSNTAGGEPVEDDAPIKVIREIVATWYIVIRNIVIASLALLLIYAGTRMAIATIASDKAKYKEFFVGWLKSVIILFVINYIMLGVLSLNDLVVNMISEGSKSSDEVTMYETIRTRAQDLFSGAGPGISAMFMYLALVFMFFRFSWVYVKRFFTVIILTIIAPFIAGKYAYDSASGKKSNALSTWLYQYCSNVLIQIVHAILYASIVGTALDLSDESVTSFIIALVFLNFMLSADKIALNLFRFDNKVQDLQKPFKARENLSGMFYAYGTYKIAKSTAQKGMNYGKYLVKTAPFQNNKVSEQVKKVGEAKDEVLNKIDYALMGKQFREDLKDPNKRNKVNPNLAQQILYLRRESRRKGEAGAINKQTLKLKVGYYTSRFKSGYKFIKDDVVGVGSVVLAIPMAVLNPGAGIGLAAQGVKKLRGNARSDELMHMTTAQKGLNIVTLGQYKNRVEDRRKSERTKSKIDKTVLSTIRSVSIMDEIETDFLELEEDEKAEVKDLLEAEASTFRNNVVYYMNTFSEKEKKGFDIDFVNMTAKDRQNMANYVIGIVGRECNVDQSVMDEMKSYVLRRLDDIQFETEKEAARLQEIEVRKDKKTSLEDERKTNTGKFVGAIKDTVEEFVIKPKIAQNGKYSRFTQNLEILNGKKDEANAALTDQADGDEENLRLFDVKNFVDNLK